MGAGPVSGGEGEAPHHAVATVGDEGARPALVGELGHRAGQPAGMNAFRRPVGFGRPRIPAGASRVGDVVSPHLPAPGIALPGRGEGAHRGRHVPRQRQLGAAQPAEVLRAHVYLDHPLVGGEQGEPAVDEVGVEAGAEQEGHVRRGQRHPAVHQAAGAVGVAVIDDPPGRAGGDQGDPGRLDELGERGPRTREEGPRPGQHHRALRGGEQRHRPSQPLRRGDGARFARMAARVR